MTHRMTIPLRALLTAVHGLLTCDVLLVLVLLSAICFGQKATDLPQLHDGDTNGTDWQIAQAARLEQVAVERKAISTATLTAQTKAALATLTDRLNYRLRTAIDRVKRDPHAITPEVVESANAWDDFATKGRALLSLAEQQQLYVLEREFTEEAAPGWCARLRGPSGRAVEFSPDGGRILTADSNAVIIWDAQTLKPLGPPRHFRNSIDFAGFAADGKNAYAGGGSQIDFWKIEPAVPIASVHLAANLLSLGVSNDGTRIVTTAGAPTADVWDVSTGRKSLQLRHEAKVQFVRFLAGDRVLTICDDQIARVWDKEGKTVLCSFGAEDRDAELPPRQRSGQAAALSTDGSTAATLFASDVEVWSIPQGRFLGEIDSVAPAGIARIVAFSPDGQLLLTAGDGIAIWKVATRRPYGNLAGSLLSTVRRALFTADGKHVLVSADGNDSGVWDIATGQRAVAFDPRGSERGIGSLQNAKPSRFPSIAIRADSKMFASAYPDYGYTNLWTIPIHGTSPQP